MASSPARRSMSAVVQAWERSSSDAWLVWWFRNSLHSRRESAEGISEPKPHQLYMLASVPLIPKFASEVTAMVCELRNRDTSGWREMADEDNLIVGVWKLVSVM